MSSTSRRALVLVLVLSVCALATAAATRPASGRCSRSASACRTRRFRFDDLDVDRRGDDILARVRVRNVSDRAGSTVAQAYVSFPDAAGEPPWQLKGYEKVRLAPGRSARVTFRLRPRDDLGVFDEAAHRFVLVPGRYTLAVGASSRDLTERASFVPSARRRR